MLVDLSIRETRGLDQGPDHPWLALWPGSARGVFACLISATARPTSHSAPVYTEHGVIHYCVPNMPGAYPRTATIALTDATLPYAIRLADQGLDALREDEHFARGVNTHHGHVCYRPVAEDLGLVQRYEDFSKLTG